MVLNENNLQEELVASKVEHEDTILSEEIKRNTEIKQPTIEVEKQARRISDCQSRRKT